MVRRRLLKGGCYGKVAKPPIRFKVGETARQQPLKASLRGITGAGFRPVRVPTVTSSANARPPAVEPGSVTSG